MARLPRVSRPRLRGPSTLVGPDSRLRPDQDSLPNLTGWPLPSSPGPGPSGLPPATPPLTRRTLGLQPLSPSADPTPPPVRLPAPDLRTSNSLPSPSGVIRRDFSLLDPFPCPVAHSIRVNGPPLLPVWTAGSGPPLTPTQGRLSK